MATARIIRNLPEPPLPATHIYHSKMYINPVVEKSQLEFMDLDNLTPIRKKGRAAALTQEDKKRIRNMRSNGKSCSEIAAVLGRSQQSIRSWCGRNGIKAAVRHTLTDSEVETVLELHGKGLNKKQIADRTKIPYSRIKYIVHLHGGE